MIRAAVDLKWNLPYLVQKVDPTLGRDDVLVVGNDLVITKAGVSQTKLDAEIAAYKQADADAWQESKAVTESESAIYSDVALFAVVKLLVSEINKLRQRAGLATYTAEQVKAAIQDEIKNARSDVLTRGKAGGGAKA